MATKDMTTYLVVTTQGKKKVTVPSSWKVTYGPVSPGSKYGGGDNVLRFYEAENKQRALFTNVREFRDLSIEVVSQKIEKRRKSAQVISDNMLESADQYEEEASWLVEEV